MELTIQEIDALSNEHPFLFKLYLFLKIRMGTNFISSGFSYSDIQNFMFVPSSKGKKSIIFSRHQIRYLLNQLIESGLIRQRRDIDSFSFELITDKLSTDLYTHYHNDTKSYTQDNTHTFTPISALTYQQKNNNNIMNNNELSENTQCNCAHTLTHRFTHKINTVYELTNCIKYIGNDIVFNNYHLVQSECIYNNIIHIKKYNNNNNNNIYINNNNNTYFVTLNLFEKAKKLNIDSINKSVKKQIKDIFDEFWKLYPKKVDPHRCLRKFISICKNNEETAMKILDGLKRYIPVYEFVEKRYIPNPHTWLNGGRWEDDIESLKEKIF